MIGLYSHPFFQFLRSAPSLVGGLVQKQIELRMMASADDSVGHLTPVLFYFGPKRVFCKLQVPVATSRIFLWVSNVRPNANQI